MKHMISYDEALHIEAYRLQGVVKPFPNHFHNYYVIGFIESGTRSMSCCGHEYTIVRGDVILLNPGDSHGCVQSDGGSFDYRALNIPIEVMRQLSVSVFGEGKVPRFTSNLIRNNEIYSCLTSLHDMIMHGWKEFERDELLYTLISLLVELNDKAAGANDNAYGADIERAVRYMSEHYGEHITLKQLCECSRMSKSTLLREFTKAKGVTPYRYLQAIRIDIAKKLLEAGVSPVEAALATGFSDQSHFSNAFSMFIGLPPSEYKRIFKEK